MGGVTEGGRRGREEEKGREDDSWTRKGGRTNWWMQEEMEGAEGGRERWKRCLEAHKAEQDMEGLDGTRASHGDDQGEAWIKLDGTRIPCLGMYL